MSMSSGPPALAAAARACTVKPAGRGMVVAERQLRSVLWGSVGGRLMKTYAAQSSNAILLDMHRLRHPACCTHWAGPIAAAAAVGCCHLPHISPHSSSPKSNSEAWPDVLRARPLPVRCGAACCCRLGAACCAAVLGPARPRAGGAGACCACCAIGGM